MQGRKQGKSNRDGAASAADTADLVRTETQTSVPATPRSQITGRHDAGSGANETIDGLTSNEEALRKGAEEIPLGAPDEPIEDVPVFDRADLPPKV